MEIVEIETFIILIFLFFLDSHFSKLQFLNQDQDCK